MKKTSEPIVFFGSGPVAAKSLELLLQHFVVKAVVTKPRPHHHRGEVPVIDLAEREGLPLFTAEDANGLEKLCDQGVVKARVAILIDFGIIVTQKVIDYFPLGIINSHFSLLPEWRGADPITFSILSGQGETGVSLMLLVEALDEGPLLAQKAIEIPNDTTTPLLTEELINVSNDLLLETVPQYLEGQVKPLPQAADTKEPNYSRKLTKEDGVLDWAKPAIQLEREVRAFSEWPKSRTNFDDLEVIVTASHVVDAKGTVGARVILEKQPVVYCGTQAIALDKLKPAGKKEMTGEAFLAGYRSHFVTR
jgi:methionyl-tRNA formyltransferase